MLINALNDYYDFLSAAGKAAPQGTSPQKITHMIALRADGSVSDIIDVREPGEPDKNSKSKLERINVILPKREQRTSDIHPNIIEHDPQYIFGLSYDKGAEIFSDKNKKDKEKHERFVELNLEYTEGMTSDIVTAYRNFLKSWVPENETENAELLKIAKDYPSAYFIFCLDGHPEITLHDENGEIMQKVAQNADAGNEKIDGVCAVTGKPAEISDKHDVIKGIRGGAVSDKRLVSFKHSAFESYGKKKSYNSSISKEVMKRYTEAFNILLSDPKHHIYLDDMTVVFWAMSKDDGKETDTLMSMFGFGDEKADASEVDEWLENALKELSEGRKIDLSTAGIDENVTFYVAGLAPNSSRIAQKFIYRDKYGKIFENAARHQLDMKIDGGERQISIGRMLYEMRSPKSRNETTPPPVIAAIFTAILNGTRYPDTLLETIVRRVKVDKSINCERAGIIKACINRNLRLNEKEEIEVSLDKTNTNEAYLCGRLFAVLERIQTNALGNLNRTIKDSYFASACSTPSLVFPKLISLAQNHLKKVKSQKEALYIKYNKLIGEIIDMLGTEFPSTLSLQEQGRFMIGYYQQVQDFYKKNGKQENANND